MENLSTSDFLAHKYDEFSNFCYVQIGVRDAFEIHDLAQTYKNAQFILFDTEEYIKKAKQNFLKYDNRIEYFAQPNDVFDIQSFSLALQHNKKAFMDYCVVHASGTLEENALAFFLIDTFIKTEGYIDVDEEFIPVLTDIVDNYERYTQCVHNKIYQKIF